MTVKIDLRELRNPDQATMRSLDDWAGRGVLADLPFWARGLVSDSTEQELRVDGLVQRDVVGPSLSWRSVVVPGARDMPAAELTSETARAYRRLLADVTPASIARLWNFIPGINESESDGRDRYMVFNAGRFEAYQSLLGEDAEYPVASGVGHTGDGLVLHLLHGSIVRKTVGNPRQIPPERYSSAFGPLPPAFCRAAIVDIQNASSPWFFMSGTASVRGEASFHLEDVDSQLHETVVNLQALRDVAIAEHDVRFDFHSDVEWLVYVADRAWVGKVRSGLASALGVPEERIQSRVQKLCRPELMLEVEGGFPLSNDQGGHG